MNEPTEIVVRERRRTKDWERVTRGIYAKKQPRSLAEDLSGWQLMLPPTAPFSHLSAAELRGWWVAGVRAAPGVRRDAR